jgi:homocysteine S-methyltransferase
MLARSARDELADDGVQRWVAASVGPYGAALADGSEYRGRYGVSRTALSDFHRPRLEALAAAGPDVLAIETIPDVDEAEVLVEAVADVGLPAWLSYTVAGGQTRAGQSLTDAFAVATGCEQLIAVGVNCCAPAEAESAVALAAAVTGKSAVAYPNSGESWDTDHRSWQGNRGFAASLAPRWQAAGARVIGGCCRISPADITALAAALAS